MANHKIKIEGIADFSSISKELDGLQKTVQKSFGKKGTKLIDDSSLAFLKKDINTTTTKLHAQLVKLKKEAKELNKEIAGSTGNEKKLDDLSKKRRENIEKTLSAQKQLNANEKFEGRIENGGEMPDNVRPIRKFGGMAADSVKDAASHIPVVGEAVGIGSKTMQAGSAASEAGLGVAAIAGLSALALAAGIAAVAITRMANGFQAFKAVVPQLLSLGSMHVKPIEDQGTLGRAAELGYNEPEVLGIQKAQNQAFGKASPGQDQNRLVNILTASRSLGLDPNEITSGGNQLRAAGGTDMANKQMSLILEKAITSGMDKTQSSAYLAASVGLLSELNQNGTANSSQMLGVMADLVGKGKMSPEQAAKSLNGINSAVANSSGESNAFFQTAAAQAGLGGNTILGSQMAVRQGLVGTDMDALQNQVGDTKSGKMGIGAIQEMGLGDSNYTQKFAKSILDSINSRYDTKDPAGARGALGMTSQIFGTKTAAESTKVLALLEKMGNGINLGADEKKLLEDLGKDPDAAWRDKTLSDLDKLVEIARQTAASQATGDNKSIELGKVVAPMFNALTNATSKLDATLANLGGAGDASGMDFSQIGKDIAPYINSELDKLGDMIAQGLSDGWDMIYEKLTGAATTVGSLVDRGEEGVGSLLNAGEDKLSGLWDKVKNPFGSNSSPAANTNAAALQSAGPAPNAAEMVTELKKTNHLLEKSLKQQFAPRAGRDPSRN